VPEDFHPFIGTGEDRFSAASRPKYGVQFELGADKHAPNEIYLQLIPGRPAAAVRCARLRRRGPRARPEAGASATSADRIKLHGKSGRDSAAGKSFRCGGHRRRMSSVRSPSGYFPARRGAARRRAGRPASSSRMRRAGLQAGKAAGCRCPRHHQHVRRGPAARRRRRLDRVRISPTPSGCSPTSPPAEAAGNSGSFSTKD